MANIDIDTTDPQYLQLYNGLGALRTRLAPQIAILRKLPRAKQRAWILRDPLLRRTFRLMRDLKKFMHVVEELAE